MARSHHHNKNTNIKNSASQKICFDKQQLLKNDIDNHKISSILKLTKKQDHESSFKRKLLREYIISQLEDPDFVRPYTNFEKHLLSKIITSKKTLGKEWEKNPEVVWN